jgi:hypothetical protein
LDESRLALVAYSKRHKLFFGLTEVDIESQLVDWQQANPGVPFKRHAIQPLSLPPTSRRNYLAKVPPAFSMRIDYDAAHEPKPKTTHGI